MKNILGLGACWIALSAILQGCADYNDKEDFVLFFELADTAGVTSDHNSTGGVSWVDYDGDGDLDLFVTNGYDVSAEAPVGQPNRVYRNEGSGVFVTVTEGALATSEDFSSASTWGDYDNDGDLDVFVANQQEQNNNLYRNDGDGLFVLISDEPPTLDGGHSYAAAWVDVDNDGLLDLFVGNGGLSHAGTNGLYRGSGDGHFEKITEGEIVTDEAATCGAAWGDYDNDGDIDLFLANQGFAPPGNNNALYRNDGDWKFTKIVDSAAVTDGAPSCVATWVDVDNDLDLDLHVCNMYGMADFFYFNDGQGGLAPLEGSPLTLDGGHSYGANWEDYDNDGDLDAVVANWGASPAVYLNDGNGNFVRARTGALGASIEFVGAMASGDYDGDGDIDVCIGNWPNNPGAGELNSLYHNSGTGEHWLRVRLVGPGGSLGGIGARVIVTTAAGSQMREITSQMGFRGQSDLSPHFGLGEQDQVSLVEVQWPSGQISTLEIVAADQVVEVVGP